MNRLALRVGAAAALAVLAGCRKEEVAAVAAEPMSVSVTRLKPDTPMKDVIRVQGSLRVKDAAAVAARVPGTIDRIDVEEGARVAAGTVLFAIDQANLSNAVRAASDDLAIARAKTAEAAAALEKAAMDHARLDRLLAHGAVTKDQAERAALQHKVAAAAAEAARALVTKAEAGLAVAEKNLADSVVKAPFDGVLTKKLKNAGDYAGPGTPVFRMENTAVHEISCQLNSDRYADVAVGKTALVAKNPASLAGRAFPLTYKAAAVNGKSRTFEVRAEVPMGADMVSGMIIDAEIVTRTFTAATLPISALAFRGERWVAFVVENGAVASREVTRGAAFEGRVEIRDPETLAGQDVVARGILLLNEGDAVRVAPEADGKKED